MLQKSSAARLEGEVARVGDCETVEGSAQIALELVGWLARHAGNIALGDSDALQAGGRGLRGGAGVARTGGDACRPEHGCGGRDQNRRRRDLVTQTPAGANSERRTLQIMFEASGADSRGGVADGQQRALWALVRGVDGEGVFACGKHFGDGVVGDKYEGRGGCACDGDGFAQTSQLAVEARGDGTQDARQQGRGRQAVVLPPVEDSVETFSEAGAVLMQVLYDAWACPTVFLPHR
eukprot:CAMPEP_0196664852 /NCGR_PEP_ID=MMETSP1086-20130531/58696_1 /TAXON_ID=77921 /ORGANISM="Cyanoptyche  gloeocystis , Strain SAG4.97" /LENGTH=235 /DNA_ID=CAMNT_0042001337 /DNA_START=224 /DNA_END=932 /DNA_ORIENTATION=+